jgi:hypothetical protein
MLLLLEFVTMYCRFMNLVVKKAVMMGHMPLIMIRISATRLTRPGAFCQIINLIMHFVSLWKHTVALLLLK